MLQSMTGYGSAKGKIDNRLVLIEVKSVNHKFCEISLRASQKYSVLDGRILELAKSFFSRGRIEISIKEYVQETGSSEAKIDLSKLRSYHRTLKKAARLLKINDDISMDTLIHLPNVLKIEEEEDVEKFWLRLSPLLKNSFVSLEKMRKKEGAATGRFLTSQLEKLKTETAWIKKQVVGNVDRHQKNLNDRLAKLLAVNQVDPQKLAQEVAFFADKTDVSEELQRLEQHGTHFSELLQSKEAVGRKFDFLLQEMNREVNTLSAKAQDAMISRHVVECKHLLEKMREQVQNVE